MLSKTQDEPRKSVDSHPSRRTGHTPMDDLVPQQSKNQSSVISSSNSQLNVQSPPAPAIQSSLSHAHPSMSPHRISRDTQHSCVSSDSDTSGVISVPSNSEDVKSEAVNLCAKGAVNVKSVNAKSKNKAEVEEADQQPCANLMNDGHACKEECHFGGHDQIICQEPCNRLRPSNCKHACAKKYFECSKNGVCPPCPVKTSVKLICNHDYVGSCHELQHLDRIKCLEIVRVVFPCRNHDKLMPCYESHPRDKLKCPRETEIDLDCGHTAVVTQCGVEPVCTHVFEDVLECGHTCRYKCSERRLHYRSEGVASCLKQSICGHPCANCCGNPDDHMDGRTEMCSHGYKGTEKCYERGNRPPCNEPCNRTLRCFHTCSGVCGGPCPPCVTCNGHRECSITLRTLSEFEENEKVDSYNNKVYMLPECHCTFSVDDLCLHMWSAVSLSLEQSKCIAPNEGTQGKVKTYTPTLRRETLTALKNLLGLTR